MKGLRRPGDWSLRDSGSVGLQYMAVCVLGRPNYSLRSRISLDDVNPKTFGEQINVF